MIGLAVALVIMTQTSAGGWDIGKSDERCIASQSFEGAGSTELVVSIELDGSAVVMVQNENWSTVKGQRYPDVSISVDQDIYSGGVATGVGDLLSKGFVIGVPAEFLDDFAKGRTLRFHNGGTLVDSLSLSGSAAAVGSLRRCMEVVRRENQAAERERQRLAHIPIDPFASPIETKDDPPQSYGGGDWSRPPRPTERDFPQRALDRGVNGAATIECMVTPSGRPEGCRVVSEEPSGMGFGAAAVRVVLRGQLSPRTFDSGQPGDRFTVEIPFSLDR
jgi:TonB family protein